MPGPGCSSGGGTPRMRKEERAGKNPKQGTGALGGFMPTPTGKVLKQAFGTNKQDKQGK